MVSYDKHSGSLFFLRTELLGREDKDEDANIYWIISSKKKKVIRIWKMKHWIALCGELTLEEAMVLWQDRLCNEY